MSRFIDWLVRRFGGYSDFHVDFVSISDSAPSTQRLPDGKPEDIAQPRTFQRRQSCQEQSDIDSDCLIVAPEIVFIDLVDDDEDIRITEEPVCVVIDKEQENEPKDISKAVTEGRAGGTVKSSLLQTKEEKGTLKRKRSSDECQENFVLDTKKARRDDDEASSQYNCGGHVSMQIRFVRTLLLKSIKFTVPKPHVDCRLEHHWHKGTDS